MSSETAAETPETGVLRWHAPKTGTYAPTLVRPDAGQRLWGVGIAVEQQRAQAQNLEIAAATRSDVVLCEPIVRCRWHIVNVTTLIVHRHQRIEGEQAWAHCQASGGAVQGIEVHVKVANAQGVIYTEQWPTPWALITEGGGSEPDEIRIAWSGEAAPDEGAVQRAVGGVLVHGAPRYDQGWMADQASEHARVIAVRDTAGVDAARTLAMTSSVENALRTFGLESAAGGERVEVRLNGPAPNPVETTTEHNIGSLEARHPWWLTGVGGWDAEPWTGSGRPGEIGIVCGAHGGLICAQKRNVPAQGPHAADIAREVGTVLEDRMLEEHIAQALAQVLVTPANERWPEGWKIPTGRLRYWLGLVRVRERRAPLWVAGAAVGDGRCVVVSLPPPGRHFEVMAKAARKHSDDDIRKWGHGRQGFVDQHGRWLSRADAEEVARAAGQLRGSIIGGVLTSEDLW